MVLRLNDDDHPNEFISFISSLKRDTEELAREYLKRIAAMAYPIMKKNGLGLTSLDEAAYNAKFWGRNWNKGECVELVLQDARGHWLPFEFVMDVFLHELCHVWRSPHDAVFHKHLAALRQELVVLLSKGYKGEKKYMTWDRFPLASVVGSMAPMHGGPTSLQQRSHLSQIELCGGSLSRRRRRSKAAATPSTKGRKSTSSSTRQQRVRKPKPKGEKLGRDLGLRASLLQSTAKPQAQSSRGREARVAAALLRSQTDSGTQKTLQWPHKEPNSSLI
ncbi:WLM domain-containing protein [Schizosaccharomyces japonicus yFS275]|uniref:WLM domain-containing protein n=1 Tax=Schizosaccharomyces japonicus (strain yFS275 / FY16936) TaxID=402676 RepID=B6JVJ5_SCHJY|nr:WLM domain-containing protein [Schizosaccharomyces japonicus yFS275]EEB05396.1 WLM domain-containing protein [Schizosaccharomyces japonicus yFS275]